MTDGSWDSFVRNTPIGFIPVGIAGPVRAYQIAFGPMADILRHFEAVATPAHWPHWLTEGGAAEVRCAINQARRAERVRVASTKHYPPPNARRS